MKLGKLLLGASILGTTTLSHAVLIEGTFEGTITSSVLGTTSNGTWSNTYDSLVNQTVTGAFSFDTDNLPASLQSDAYQELYIQPGYYNWLDISLQVGGSTYDVPDLAGGVPASSTDMISIRNDQPNTSGELDLLTMSESFVTSNQGYPLDERVEVTSYLSINDYADTDFLTSLLLDQNTIDITDFSTFDYASGAFSNSSFTEHLESGRLEDGGSLLSFNYDLTSFQMPTTPVVTPPDPPTPSVPEPSLFALFGIGLIGMGIARRRTRS